ncbi:MAG TPA: PBP1A family penicillin-binding protein [Longimicrobiales bacterium]|nr:PBP1A family penicillin-binding protein [Longimicrobiales bacterium]
MAVRTETREVPEREGPGPFALRSILTALGTVMAVTIVVFFAAYHTCGFEGCPDLDQIRGYVPDEASVVVDRDDEEIGKLFRVNRVMVGLDTLPEHIPQAFIATEDQDFYDHGGVDFSRVLGAAWENVRSGGIAEGFSTISMQVARNVFPEKLPANQRTLSRKVSEIKVARALEGRYGKDEILELYVNQIYFGSGAWGIQAAAQEYFGKSATELDLAESALLAGLPQAPSRLNPRENMEGALRRRATVLERMRSQGFITADEAAAAGDDEPRLARSRVEISDRAAYFVEHVRQTVEERLGDDVYTQGYTIHTTLDLDAQEVAERELAEQLRAIESGRYGSFPHPAYASTSDSAAALLSKSPYLQGAVVVMAVNSGDVLAMIGGRDFDQSKFNRAIQARRQPGSAFKPIVYAAAIDAGYPPNTPLEDTPYRLARDGRVWEPQNYDGTYAGRITMREALVHSKNVATIRLAERVGLGRVIEMARRLGISGDIPHYPSIAIGAAEVTLVEIVAAYAALAALGDLPEPRYVTHVTDRSGAIVWQESPRTRRVLNRDVAFLTVDLMRDVINRGTGAAARSAGFRAPAAGKTGTTNESADVWFIGFTPQIATGVWIGMDDPQRIMPRATGGRLAAPVFGGIMRSVAGNGGDWTPPPGVERLQVDESGNILASNCPTYGTIREEYFLRGTVSVGDCFGYGYSYGDSFYADTLGGVGAAEEESWWRRLRERLFSDDEPPADTMPPPPHDTVRPPPHDTIIIPDRRTPPDTIRLPSDRPDTSRPLGRDTILRPPPDTSPAAPGGGDPAGAPASDPSAEPVGEPAGNPDGGAS